MKKRLILIIFFVGFFSSCLIEKTEINLVDKNGKNIVLLDKDDIKINVFARLNERFDSGDSLNRNAVNVSVTVNEFKTLRVKNFFLLIKEKSNDTFKKILNGKVSSDKEMLSFRKSFDIKNNISDLDFKPQSYPLNTMFIIETESSNRTFTSNEFIIETNLEFVLNNKEYSINKIDTLYRKTVKKTQVRAH